MNCCQCGKEIKDGSNFCPECGAAQPVQASQPQYNQPVGQGQYNQAQQNYSRPPQYNQQPPVNYSYQPTYNSVPQKGKTNTLSLVGFIMSIVSPLLCCGILNVPALIISIIGINDCKKKNEDGHGFAVAGIVISAIVIVLGIILAIIERALIPEILSYLEYYFNY